MPTITRFNHENGVAPYNGVFAVTANSRALMQHEYDKDERYGQAAKECEDVAKLLEVTAPIRIDIRRFNDEPGAKFALFDINMKPVSMPLTAMPYFTPSDCNGGQNMTGPGPPGREKQASLTAISAAALGWTYPTLLQKLLGTARSLETLRNVRSNL